MRKVENNPQNYTKNINKTYKINFFEEKEILDSMKQSLDTFLFDLKAKSFSKNMTKQDIQNYYLTENELFNSLNFDLVSSYKKLLHNNINKNNHPIAKRSYSSKEILDRQNNYMHKYNNKNYNEYNNNLINSYYDKNSNEITKSNLIFNNGNDTINRNYLNNKRMKNYTLNTPNKINMNNNKMQNIKFDFPTKIINNQYLNSRPLLNKSNSFQNNIFNNEISKNHSNIFSTINSNKNCDNWNNIIYYVINQFKNIKDDNKKNKIEIKEFYNNYSKLMNEIFIKIKMYLYKNESLQNEKIEKYRNELKSLKNINDSYKKENKVFKEIVNNYNSEKENNSYKLVEEQNNKIFLLKEEMKGKDDKIKRLIEEQNEHKKTIEGFKKVMKDVKLTMEDYEKLKKKKDEYDKVLTNYNESNEELNKKLKELDLKNKRLKIQIDLFKREKRNISIENERNKSFVNNYKISYDSLVKEKDKLKKEKGKLINEIEIIKKNNKRMNDIKINNNIKIQNNAKLRETINILNKEKNDLELKYKTLQISLDEQAMKNKSISASNLKSSKFLKNKKFLNLIQIKTKSFTIYNLKKAKEQQQRMSPNKKKKKFIKLSISNNITLTFRYNNKKYKNKDNLKNSNNINIIKSNKIKQKNTYINEIYNCELFSIIKNKKPKEEIMTDNNEYINKINNLNKEIKEKNEYINILEKEKNNQNKPQVISDTGNFQINKLKELNNLLKDKCNKLQKENENLKLNNKNSNINSSNILPNDEIDNLKKENSEKEKKINDLNLTIESLYNEIKELKLKLLKNISKSEEDNDDKKNNDNNEEIKKLNETVEKLQKEKNDINRTKMGELAKLRIEITQLKLENISMKNELENYKERNDKKDDNVIDENNRKIIEDLKNYNNKLKNILSESQDKINKANKVLKKAKIYNLYYKYVSQLIEMIKPSNKKEEELFSNLQKLIENEHKDKANGEKSFETDESNN